FISSVVKSRKLRRETTRMIGHEQQANIQATRRIACRGDNSNCGYSHKDDIQGRMVNMLAVDPHIVDVLLPDLIGHDKRPSSFVLYLWLYAMTKGVNRKTAFFSYQMLTDRTGLSKRAVQRAAAHLQRRQLIRVTRTSATAVPEYGVLTPWVRT